MTTWSTKVDQRISGTEPLLTNEAHVVSEDLTNYVLLNEIPLRETLAPILVTYNSLPFVEVTTSPSAGQFQAVYTGRLAGALLFNAADSGKTVLVTYKGRGSNVLARDINRLQQYKLDADATALNGTSIPASSTLVTTTNSTTLTAKVVDSITNKVGADHVHYKIKASVPLTKGQTLRAVGYTPGEEAIDVAPIASSSDVAVGVAYETLAAGSYGSAVNTGLLTGVKTDYAGWALGDVLYPDPVTGGFTKTKPTSGQYQACAYVMRVQANNGVLLCEFTEPQWTSATTSTANTLALRDGASALNASAFNVTSDLSLKEQVQDAGDVGALLEQIRVRQFTWRETGGQVQYGVIAQELRECFPMAVRTVEDGPWSVDLSQVVFLLVKEMQALRQELAILRQ